MDTVNHFFTPATALHARLEYGLGFAACFLLMLFNWSDLDVWHAVLLFGYIDLVGTAPGMLAFRRSPDGNIARAYFVLYNVMHSAVTQGLVVTAYILVFGWEWAILAIPAHVCADRSVFNNYPKPYGLAFEPVPHPAFERFEADYRMYHGITMNWKLIAQKGSAAADPFRARSAEADPSRNPSVSTSESVRSADDD
ncbi:hypothetical protein ACTD5D_17080 [Nocardia takedensis]|uniref:hypothetical protein n=1 Tax=Nocardia takedensis TaxID=259390 RepID=UPI000307C42E|nr:hypothetical protein [Nocardia takedensis]